MTDTPRTDEIDWLAIDDAYSEALEERCTCGDWRDDISCRHCSLWEKARSLMRQRIAELEPDAERYRWLRAHLHAQSLTTTYALPITWHVDYRGQEGRSMDAAIDAAREEEIKR